MTLTIISPVPTVPEIRYDYSFWLWWAIPVVAVLVLILCAAAVVADWRTKRREAPAQPQETTLARRRKGRTHP